MVFAVVVLIGFVGLYWRWLLVAGCAVMLVRWGLREYARQKAAGEAERERLAGVAARADLQHQEVIAGDEHGIYGDAWTAMRKYRDVA